VRVRVYGLVACLRAHARVSLQPSPAICLEAGSWLLHSAVCSMEGRELMAITSYIQFRQ